MGYETPNISTEHLLFVPPRRPSGSLIVSPIDRRKILSHTLGECICKCHNPPDGGIIMHCVACCRQCPHCEKNISMNQYDEHKQKCAPIHSLDIELACFNKHREEWFKHHAGKFALIKEDTIHNFYDTRNRAYEMGCLLWGLVPFLIKEVLLEDRVIFMPDRIKGDD